MLKKISAVLLTAAVAASCFAGCTKPEEETVTLNIKVPTLSMTSYCDESIVNAAQFIKKAAESFEEDYLKERPKAKIRLNVTEFPIANETHYITDTFGTATSPDVLYEGYFNMSTYIYTGRVVPLDDIIDEAMIADIPSQYLDLSRVNGKTYMMPYLTAQNTMSFNRDIFEAAGLTEYIGEDKKNVVQTWSLEEWDDVLSRLKAYCDKHNAEIDAGGEGKLIYPMMMYAANDQGDTHIMTLLRSRGCTFFDGDGNIKVNTPEGIAALKWLQDGALNGYFPENCENSAIIQNTDLFTSGQLALLINNAASEATSEKEGIDVYSVNFPYSVAGKGLSTDFITGFEVFDNDDAKKIELAKAFVKYVYKSEYIDYMAGSIPCSNAVSQKYATELQHISKYVNNDAESWNFTNNSPNWRGVRDVFWKNIHELLSYKPDMPEAVAAKKTPEAVAAAIDESCNAALAEGWASSTLHN